MLASRKHQSFSAGSNSSSLPVSKTPAKILLATLVLLVGLVGEVLVPTQSATGEEEPARIVGASAQATTSEDGEERTRTRSATSWVASTSAWVWSNCTGIVPTIEDPHDQTQCSERTRTVGVWSNGSFSTSSCSPGTNEGTYFRQCESQTRPISPWSGWSSWSYSNCSYNQRGETSSGGEQQCSRRTRGRTSWSTSSWGFSSCSSSSSGSTQRQCQSRDRSRGSWSTGSWSYSNCSATSGGNTERQCRFRNVSRVWGSWSTNTNVSSCSWYSNINGQRQCRFRVGTATGSWGFQNCARRQTGDSWQLCDQRTRSSFLTFGSQSSWSFSSCSGSSPGAVGGSSGRQCQPRTRSWAGWSTGSWAYSSCSASSSSTYQRQCRNRTRGWASWSNAGSGWMNCSASSGDNSQAQCRSRNRSVGSYTNNGFGPDSASCSAGYNDGTVQRRCRNRTRSISAWSSGTSWADTATCVFFQTGNSSNTETQCRTRDRQRAWGPWGSWSAWTATGDSCVVGSSSTETSIGGPEARSGSQEQTQCRESFTYNPTAPTGAAFRGPLRPS